MSATGIRPLFPRLDAALAMPYADNSNLIAATKEAATRIYKDMVSVLEERGFVLRDHVCAEPSMTFLGYAFHGQTRTLGHTRRRCWRLHWALGDVLRHGWGLC